MRIAGSPVEVADHVVELADGWTLWRWIWLRGAGLPVDLVLRLATPDSAGAAAALTALEEERAALRRGALSSCERALAGSQAPVRPALTRVMQGLRSGDDAPDPSGLPPPVIDALAALREIAERAAARRADLVALFDRESTAARASLQDMFRGGPMLEALVWQNRRVVSASVAGCLRRSPAESDSKSRKHEKALASYVQRYCVKNDTIGFFGPVGWARWSDSLDGIALRPGRHLVDRRTVHFEYWAMDALAARLATDPALRRSLAPRRMPTVRVEGTVLHYAVDRTAVLPPAYAALLAGCDGETSAVELARRLLAEPELELADEAEVWELLDELASRGLVTWTIELPTDDLHPERHLRGQLDKVADEPARTRALAVLDQLEAGRATIERAAGDPVALDAALGSLETSFVELTGVAATRREGETYAGRTIVYEDCRRDVELEIGVAVREALSAPLRLLLVAARWYTYEVARRYRALFRAVHEELRRAKGSDAVGFLAYRERVEVQFAGNQLEPPPIVREVASELRERWARVLGVTGSERHVSRSSAELAPRVEEAFRAPHPGWPNARYHSPDVLIAAGGAAGIARGDYQLVLGELHPGDNTLLRRIAVEQHPSPLELVRCRELDRPEIGISVVEARQHAMRGGLTCSARHDIHVEIGGTRSIRPRDQVVAAADLVVEEVGGQLLVKTRDDRHRFDVVAFFERQLMFASIVHFGLLATQAHTPRVNIDRLVVAREGWQFRADELAFAGAATALERFMGAQRWREEHRLPRFVFARTAGEPKPMYADLSSGVYVELLSRLARSAGTIGFSEMLPSHEQTWLADGEGRLYTSELRMVAIDPQPWRPG